MKKTMMIVACIVVLAAVILSVDLVHSSKEPVPQMLDGPGMAMSIIFGDVFEISYQEGSGGNQEISEVLISVKPDSDIADTDKVIVPMEHVYNQPELKLGDPVYVQFNGSVTQDDPPRICVVYSIGIDSND